MIGAIVGEWIGSTQGIGALIIQSTYNFDSPLLYATIVVGSTFSALFFVRDLAARAARAPLEPCTLQRLIASSATRSPP